jgi:putative DNA primase/helicase
MPVPEIAADSDGPQGKGDSNGVKLLPPPSQPMQVVRAFVTQRCKHDGTLTLRHWRGGWWFWRTTHWAEVEDHTVRCLLYHFTENALYVAADKALVPWAPTRHKISDLVDALAAICILSSEVDQPSWLEDCDSDGTIVSFANGLLDIEQHGLLAHTPRYFNQTAVPFDYDPAAPPPQRWLTFLNQLWPKSMQRSTPWQNGSAT